MIGERAQDVIEQLADQNDLFPISQCYQEFLDRFAAQLRLQDIVEVFLAEQVQPILADTAKQRVQESGGESAACPIGERPRERHCRHAEPPGPALREALGIPGEKADQPHGAHFEQRAFNAPISHASRPSRPRRVFQFGYGFRHTNNDYRANTRTAAIPNVPDARILRMKDVGT